MYVILIYSRWIPIMLFKKKLPLRSFRQNSRVIKFKTTTKSLHLLFYSKKIKVTTLTNRTHRSLKTRGILKNGSDLG